MPFSILGLLVLSLILQSRLFFSGALSARLSLGNQYADVNACINACQISCQRRYTQLSSSPAPSFNTSSVSSLLSANSYASDRILIKMKQGYAFDTALLNQYRLSNSTKLFQDSSQTTTRSFMEGAGLDRLYVTQISNSDDPRTIATSLQSDPRVEYAEPDYTVSVFINPNDSSFGQLWGLHNTGQSSGTADADIDAPEAWNTTTGSATGIVVGVLDTGIDYNHPDLAANIWTNPGETAGNGIDDDSNGYIDDVHGYDFVNNDSNPMDDNGHGTHVSGTIAGVGNNSVGIAGVNWRAKVAALKFLKADGSSNVSDAVEAINYATTMGFKVTSNSWGLPTFSQAISDAITANKNQGNLFVAAAGNNSTNNDTLPIYPGSFTHDNIIAVAATNRSDALAAFSCYGAVSVDLAAPGVDVYSTLPGNNYGLLSGTSMATPHVAGAAVLLWNTNSSLGYLNVKQKILASVDVLPVLQTKVVSNGRLNIGKMFSSTSSSSSGGSNSSGGSSASTSSCGGTIVCNGNVITEYPVPIANASPAGITKGPDGNVWFTEANTHQIARITPSGTVTEYGIPTAGTPWDIVTGPDGNLWFTELFGHKIGRITPTGTVTEFIVPAAGSYLALTGITSGPDGNVWFTETNENQIGRITPSGTITEFTLPTGGAPFGIVTGPDGNLWFTDGGGNKIGKMTPSGTVTQFALPTPVSNPTVITTGPDGNLWFTEENVNKIGRITPSGTLTEFSLPTANSHPTGITTGPDGNLWFTERNVNKIGRITPSGTITEFTIPTAGSGPAGITQGPNGNIWFTEYSGNKIGKISCTGGGSCSVSSSSIASSVPGSSGSTGSIGFTGSSGSTGSIGIAGSSGSAGSTGSPGSAGAAPYTCAHEPDFSSLGCKIDLSQFRCGHFGRCIPAGSTDCTGAFLWPFGRGTVLWPRCFEKNGQRACFSADPVANPSPYGWTLCP